MSKAEIFWNRLSKNYDKNARDKSFKLIISKTKKHLTPNDVVLDFACATGLYTFELAPLVKAVQAFDTSPSMIRIAKKKLAVLKIDNIRLSQTDVFDEKYKTGTFDIILALNILLYFKDPEKVLNRMRALLKPNGLIITSTACLKEKRTLVGVFSSSIIYILKKLRILPYLKFYTMVGLEEIIKTCDFKIIDMDVLIDKPATEYYIVAKK